MSTNPTIPSTRLGTRLRHSLALAQARIHTVEKRARTRWLEVPASLRMALERTRDRIRDTFELPSRGEITLLMERMDELDRKLTELERTRTRAALPAPGELTGEPAEPREPERQPERPIERQTALAEAPASAPAAEAGGQPGQEPAPGQTTRAATSRRGKVDAARTAPRSTRALEPTSAASAAKAVKGKSTAGGGKKRGRVPASKARDSATGQPSSRREPVKPGA